MVALRLARLIIFGAVLVVSCAEPLGPGDVSGKYALQRVAGDPLPTLLFRNENVSVRVLADTLVFTSDGRGTRIEIVESEPVSGGPSEGPLRWESAFGFRINEGLIEVGFDCPMYANCVAPPHLVLRRTTNGVRADYALGERIPLTYIRVSSVP